MLDFHHEFGIETQSAWYDEDISEDENFTDLNIDNDEEYTCME